MRDMLPRDQQAAKQAHFKIDRVGQFSNKTSSSSFVGESRNKPILSDHYALPRYPEQITLLILTSKHCGDLPAAVLDAVVIRD
jgi:hypothetical protein